MKLEYLLPPFNPSDVDIRLQYISVGQLEKMIETGKLYIPETEELQIMSNSWNNQERCSFIESIMANLPVQLIYLDGSKTPWTIIDGLQRITSLHKFFQNELVLTGLEYFYKECEGMSFASIPFYLKSRVESTTLVAYVVNPGTPEAVKFNIFKRINKIGKQRNRQELRDAFYQGARARDIKKMAESEEFLQATHQMVGRKGMADRELVVRYFAFRLLYPFFYTTQSMDDFLDKGMDALLARYEEDYEKDVSRFKTTMQHCYTLLNDIAFININSVRRRINKSLFDVFTYTIARLSDDEYQNLIRHREPFYNQYRQLFEGNGFLSSIRLRNHSKEAIRERFDKMEEFVEQFI